MKNNHLLYNLRGLGYLLYPKFLGKYTIEKKISTLSKLSSNELEKISQRVNYYCSFAPISLPKTKKLTHLELLKKGSRYFFDTYEHMRFFSKHLDYILEQGDINFELHHPSLCKSRPILHTYSNNVLLNMDKIRHFKFFTTPPYQL